MFNCSCWLFTPNLRFNLCLLHLGRCFHVIASSGFVRCSVKHAMQIVGTSWCAQSTWSAALVINNQYCLSKTSAYNLDTVTAYIRCLLSLLRSSWGQTEDYRVAICFQEILGQVGLQLRIRRKPIRRDTGKALAQALVNQRTMPQASQAWWRNNAWTSALIHQVLQVPPVQVLHRILLVQLDHSWCQHN